MPSKWYPNASMAVRLESLRDRNGSAVTDATVSLVSLVDCEGETPDGITLPLAMTHDSGGTYIGAIGPDVSVEEGSVLTATIRATRPSGTQREWIEAVSIVRSKG